MKTNIATKSGRAEGCFADQPLQIIFASDDPQAGAAAHKLMGTFLEKWAPNVDSHCDDWSFSELAHVAFGREALEMARTCDMLVVSLAGHRDLPESIRDWLKDWRGSRSEGDTAVVLCAPAHALNLPTFASLPSFLSGNGVTCFVSTIPSPRPALAVPFQPKTVLRRLSQIDLNNLPENSILND